MRYLDRILLCAAIGLGLNGSLVAAQQKAVRHTARPATAKVAGQNANQVTALDQSVYLQKHQRLQEQVREDKKKLNNDELRFGSDHESVKFDRDQLRKDEKALKQLPKPHKQGAKK